MIPRFIATTELGRLARWLRVLGYDVVYDTGTKRTNLFLKSLREDRIILTRNLKLSKPTSQKVLFIKSASYREQIKEVVNNLRLNIDNSRMFTRCVVCNEELEKADRQSVKDKVPPFVFETHRDFMRCPGCRRIYWPGTHWDNIEEALKRIGVG